MNAVQVLQHRARLFHDLERRFNETNSRREEPRVSQELLEATARRSRNLREAVERLGQIPAHLQQVRAQFRQLRDSSEGAPDLTSTATNLRTWFASLGLNAITFAPESTAQTAAAVDDDEDDEFDNILAHFRTLRSTFFALAAGNLEFTHIVASRERFQRVRAIYERMESIMLRVARWLRGDTRPSLFVSTSAQALRRVTELSTAQTVRLWVEIDYLLRWARPDVVDIEGLEIPVHWQQDRTRFGAVMVPRGWDRLARWAEEFGARLDKMEGCFAHGTGNEAEELGYDTADEDGGSTDDFVHGVLAPIVVDADGADFEDGYDSEMHPSSPRPPSVASTNAEERDERELQEMVQRGRRLFHHRHHPPAADAPFEIWRSRHNLAHFQLESLYNQAEAHLTHLDADLDPLLDWYHRTWTHEEEQLTAEEGEDEALFAPGLRLRFRVAMEHEFGENERPEGDWYLQPVIDLVQRREREMSDMETEVGLRRAFEEFRWLWAEWVDGHRRFMHMEDGLVAAEGMGRQRVRLGRLVDAIDRAGAALLGYISEVARFRGDDGDEHEDALMERRVNVARDIYTRINRTTSGDTEEGNWDWTRWFSWLDRTGLMTAVRDWPGRMRYELEFMAREFGQRFYSPIDSDGSAHGDFDEDDLPEWNPSLTDFAPHPRQRQDEASPVVGDFDENNVPGWNPSLIEFGTGEHLHGNRQSQTPPPAISAPDRRSWSTREGSPGSRHRANKSPEQPSSGKRKARDTPESMEESAPKRRRMANRIPDSTDRERGCVLRAVEVRIPDYRPDRNAQAEISSRSYFDSSSGGSDNGEGCEGSGAGGLAYLPPASESTPTNPSLQPDSRRRRRRRLSWGSRSYPGRLRGELEGWEMPETRSWGVG
ncbi:uncharacterized protein EI97DRAFT_431346 [Westerdykella ornata]|uniref:Uncharacterized protein n=1 Tax=Westerdykella ornata TaxID=318751 RepID=A0A6A6JRX7_WESOR|nr:uncharacterized protein EI97DRAFT_431346 [Westerdykella ornata]KAF2279147.1 hypothetical protein EI97DRAFT_431346 [Westerdykella ornata]